jgi:hypothetical protein
MVFDLRYIHHILSHIFVFTCFIPSYTPVSRFRRTRTLRRVEPETFDNLKSELATVCQLFLGPSSRLVCAWMCAMNNNKKAKVHWTLHSNDVLDFDPQKLASEYFDTSTHRNLSLARFRRSLTTTCLHHNLNSSIAFLLAIGELKVSMYVFYTSF